MNLRASATPLAFTCAGSVRGDMQIESTNEAGPEGSAIHACLDRAITVGSMGAVDFDAVAGLHGVEAEAIRSLAWTGWRAWQTLKPSMPEARTEVALKTPDNTLTGHIDVLSVVDGRPRAAVVDWKSGRADKAHYHQLAAYAALVFANHRHVETVSSSAVWLRTSEIETYTFTLADMQRWSVRLHDEVINAENRYTTGPHCAYCPRAHSCPAVVASERRDLAVLQHADMTDAIDQGLAGLTPAARVDIYQRAGAIAERCEQIRRAVVANAELAGGVLDGGNGYSMRVADENGGRKVDALKAWPMLQARLDEEELAACMDVRISRVEKRIAEKAGRGNGAEAKRLLAAELAKAGAVAQETRRVARIVRSQHAPRPAQIQPVPQPKTGDES